MKKQALRTILLDFMNKRVAEPAFVTDHKENEKDFTRDRILAFPVMLLLLLRKSFKSLQLVLNELYIHAHISSTVSSSAYNQARKKFKHTAFIELNEGAVALFYKEAKIKRWKGYRVFGVDASSIILPKTKEIEEAYGCIKIKNQHIVRQDFWSTIFISNIEVLLVI